MEMKPAFFLPDCHNFDEPGLSAGGNRHLAPIHKAIRQMAVLMKESFPFQQLGGFVWFSPVRHYKHQNILRV